MSTPLGTRPSGPIAAVALAIALIVACSAPTTRRASDTPSPPAATSAPTAAAALATASAIVLPAAVIAGAAPSPAAERTAQASPTTAAAPSVAAAVPVATPTTPSAPATPRSASTPVGVALAATGPIAVTLLDSAIKLDRSSTPAGSVTFAIKNAGTVIHQLVVLRTDTAQDRIPADPTQPAKATQPGFIAETKDMGPGTSLVWSLPLAAGKYVLMCNQPAHYLVGMHTAFTIN